MATERNNRRRRQTLEWNKATGKARENFARDILSLQGTLNGPTTVERKPYGRDFDITTTDPLTGREKTKKVEVKPLSSPKLSKLQKQTKRETEKKGGIYEIFRSPIP